MQSSMQAQSATYANGGPVQPLQYHQNVPQAAPVPVRASSGAWTPADDATLMNARASGLNWAPIQATYFPTKTPNACRKRHERLMDRRNSDDWDTIKIENLAKEYMNMRREIWSQLGSKTGEKWSVVESKCMNAGIKNLQGFARSCARRERLEAASASAFLPVDGPYGDRDSGVGSLDDVEAEFSAETGSYGQSSLSSDEDARTGVPGYSNGSSSRGYDGRMYQQQILTDARGRQVDPNRGYMHQEQMQRPQYGSQQRLPSIDMGIGAIINRPSNRH